MLLESGGLLLHDIHYVKYSGDGEGLFFCQIIALVLEMGSQLGISLLLIGLSWGWTIVYQSSNNSCKYTPLIALLFVFHILTSALTEASFDSHHKYHDFGGFQGILLVCVRIGMLVYFFFGMQSTKSCCRSRARPFLNYLQYIGAAYLASFPILVVLCQVCVHYVRLKVMVLGTIISQTICIYILLRFFVGRTLYTAVSRNEGTVLPGGCD